MPPVATKICGLSTSEAVEAAVQGGAAYVGFVFFARSPRNITPEHAAELGRTARANGVATVAVTVDAPDAELDRIMATLSPELIQLHGGETPERVAEVRARTGAGVIRALRVSEPADLDAAAAFDQIADQLMFDAKPPAGARLPGGNGAGFDASILAGRRFARLVRDVLARTHAHRGLARWAGPSSVSIHRDFPGEVDGCESGSPR